MPDRQGTEPMYDDDPTDPAHSPIDSQGRTPVGGEGGEGWLYLPFERDEATGEHRITIVREEDGEEVQLHAARPSSSRATSWARSRCW